MNLDDAKIISDEEILQGFKPNMNKYINRLKHRDEGLCITMLAEYEGNPAGYISVYPKSIEGPWGNKDLPEIVDFGVLEKYRCKGIGSLLMDQAEKIASEYSDMVYLGVGLHEGYGQAQRMYAKRGYVPDGSGVWYGDHPCTPYEKYDNDDDLMIFMSKKLK